MATKTLIQHTIGCRYNTVQYCKISYKWLQELRQNINQMLDPKRHPIPAQNGRVMGCLLWRFVRKLTALKRYRTVFQERVVASSPSAYDYLKSRLQSPVSVYDKTSYKFSRKVSKPGDLYLELSNRSQIWQAHRQHCCPKCLSNFKAMQWFKPPISRLRDFPRSHDTTSYRIMKRDPDISRSQRGYLFVLWSRIPIFQSSAVSWRWYDFIKRLPLILV